MYKRINSIINSIKYKDLYNVEPYKIIIEKINAISYESKTLDELRGISEELKLRLKSGVPLEELIYEAYALVREAARRAVGMYPYEVQVMAALALHQGRIVEMQTGEGKTLSAVMPAYLNALSGKGVHILTFNDYLAERDAKWMGPIYELLGVSCGYVKEGMVHAVRKEAYLMDITYVTAKEAGFDYLRDSLATDVGELVHRPFNFAIVDEADSILIDEARIPLVIAGNVIAEQHEYQHIIELVRGLRGNIDYELDQYGNNISLTEEGLVHIEKAIGCGNLYEPENLQLLTRLNCVLQAELLIKKDKDYIVSEGKIEIIDEFTGRIADKRHWPDSLQEAVEAKEGVVSESKGMILGSIALQFFIKLYPKVSGMTGTAMVAYSELEEIYGLKVTVIPTNKPCIRRDHPDLIFTHKAAKEKALLKEIKRIHGKGQPLLIGTSSVEESDKLAALLWASDIPNTVLNAKNDYEEAKVIADAGGYGAVTVSTNMAGRGVDIKLGGANELDKAKVIEAGGLYVIGTSRHESIRIDKQLRGRAGRQGDPGESRFFVSLEDELIKKYEIDRLIPKEHIPEKQWTPLENTMIAKKLEGGQRIIEGYNSDIRRQLWQYSNILEQQRQMLNQKRLAVLLDKTPLTLLANHEPERYQDYLKNVGYDVINNVEKQITLFHINKKWAEYLDYVSYIKEGIHLVVIGGESPLHKFHAATIEAFNEVLDSIEKDIITTFNRVKITKEGIDLQKEGLKGPSSTWTYLISDSPSQFSRLPFLIKATKNYIKGTLFSLSRLWKR